MKLRVSAFAILAASAIVLTVAVGFFFRARAQDARQRRLVSVQRMLERTLVPGLEFQPGVISMKEFDVLSAVRRHGIARMLYLNTIAEHRFFHDIAAPARTCYDCIQEVTPHSIQVLDAIETSWETHSPTAIRFDSHDNDFIIPIASKGRTLGMVLLRTNDALLKSLPEVIAAVRPTPNRNQKHLKNNNPDRQASESANLNAREYRRKAEAMFSR